jgi:hypothetical protein
LVERLASPAVVEAAGNLPKRIEEFVGRASTGEAAISIARMTSPPGCPSALPGMSVSNSSLTTL